jgi:hypothetical protein
VSPREPGRRRAWHTNCLTIDRGGGATDGSDLVIRAVGICTPFSPPGEAIGLVMLPLSYFPWLAATLLTYCVLTQFVKVWYIRRFESWL